jgi:hypothetical protein
MATPRRKDPFWRRNDPAARFDIAELRPKKLPRGKRFETLNDARRESVRSEESLDAYRNNGLSVYLKECREGDYHCEKSYCPQCARTFRRWLIGELLRLNSSCREPVTVFTVLLESAPRITADLFKNYRHSLRKRQIALLWHTGGRRFRDDIASPKNGLHINLAFGGSGRLSQSSNGFPVRHDRPVQRAALTDPASSPFKIYDVYVHTSRSAKKSEAFPNPAQFRPGRLMSI